jgi:hypothetical protein
MTVSLQLKGKTHRLALDNLKKQLGFEQKLKTHRNCKNYLQLATGFEPMPADTYQSIYYPRNS